jgi:hypothetical protein
MRADANRIEQICFSCELPVPDGLFFALKIFHQQKTAFSPWHIFS